MGVDTKILLTSAPDLLELLDFVSDEYGHANISAAATGCGFYYLNFVDGDDDRHVAVFPPGRCSCDYADVHTGAAVYMSMGAWGNSEMIARRIAVNFGGLIMPKDTSDKWIPIAKGETQ